MVVLGRAVMNPRRACLYLYYSLKIKVLSWFVGLEAIAYVLHDSLFPLVVLRLGNAHIGDHVRVGRWLTIHESNGSFKNLYIGNDVFIGKHVVIDLSAKVMIGDRAGLGLNVTITTHANFGDSVLSGTYPPSTSEVQIMEDSQIGWGCTVLKGAVIGREVVVLPGAVVAGMLKDCATYGGNPCRQLPRAQVSSQP
jgi:acetyltransferase-like isoleucine patch superfamily enzyme